MTKKNNVFQLSAVKDRKQEKKENELSPSSIELVKKEYFELTVQTLLSALKCKDDYTWGHSLRVAYYCVTVGREMGLSEAEIYELEVSALFHDIGKIGVPDSVLLKPSRLTDDEFSQMKLHPSKSFEILKDFSVFKEIAVNAKHHHERFDGRGYPEGLKGNQIPLFARIILISDTFDAMTSTRTYRKGLSFDVAFAELNEFSGTQFDPEIVEKFISCMNKENVKNEETFNLQIINGSFKKDAA
jgi:HD-GYP domain-containing protein (c-di-GMP phosphodiesterase class II)